MTEFEALKSVWENQSEHEAPKDGVKKIIEKIEYVRKKQRIMNIILGLTSSILIWFFFYVTAYKFQSVMIGLLLMIGALVVRIATELFSLRALKTMNVSVNANTFKEQMIRYYKGRTNVHFILTPIVIVAYVIGFIVLLPSFKENLSKGLYTYISISSVLLLLILSFYIVMQIRKELHVLKDLKN